jgi:hypothetical protein
MLTMMMYRIARMMTPALRMMFELELELSLDA